MIVILTNGSELSRVCTLSLSVGSFSNTSDIYPFPNPVNRQEVTMLRFQNVPPSAFLYIYNILGNRVAILKANGTSTVRSWNLTNERGEHIQAGVYLYIVQNEGTTEIGKFSVLQ